MIPPAVLLDKKALCEVGDLLRDPIIFDVFDHLVDEFFPQPHPSFDKPGIKVGAAQLNFVCVEGILREIGKVHEHLVDFCHENHGQMRDS